MRSYIFGGGNKRGGKEKKEIFFSSVGGLILSKPTVEQLWGGPDSVLDKGAESKVTRCLSSLRLSNKLCYLQITAVAIWRLALKLALREELISQELAAIWGLSFTTSVHSRSCKTSRRLVRESPSVTSSSSRAAFLWFGPLIVLKFSYSQKKNETRPSHP